MTLFSRTLSPVGRILPARLLPVVGWWITPHLSSLRNLSAKANVKRVCLHSGIRKSWKLLIYPHFSSSWLKKASFRHTQSSVEQRGVCSVVWVILADVRGENVLFLLCCIPQWCMNSGLALANICWLCDMFSALHPIISTSLSFVTLMSHCKKSSIFTSAQKYHFRWNFQPGASLEL